MKQDYLNNLKFRKEQVNSADEDEFWFNVYERICLEFPDYGQAPFPIGLHEEAISRQPVTIQMIGHKNEGPTIAAILRKVCQCYEAEISDQYASAGDDGEGQQADTPA